MNCPVGGFLSKIRPSLDAHVQLLDPAAAGLLIAEVGMLETAAELGCTTVYSEDLNGGQDYDGVKVVNPFR